METFGTGLPGLCWKMAFECLLLYMQDWCAPEFLHVQPTVNLFLPDAGVSKYKLFRFI